VTLLSLRSTPVEDGIEARCRACFNKDGDERISDTEVDHLRPVTEHGVTTDDERPPWRTGTRVAFRFCFVYLGVFGRWLPDHAVLWQMVLLDPVTRWVGRTVFGVDAVLHPDSGSGDQAAIWLLVFGLLVVAVAATLVWSVVDRRRRAKYTRLAAWFLVFLRLCLGGQVLF
jgi:hypothetical protein